MPKFVEGDIVMRTTYASVWIGKVYTNFIHNKKMWYVGTTTEGLLWLCPEDQIQIFTCHKEEVRYVEKENTNPPLPLVSSKY